jgi:PAP2 superfamily
VVPSAAVTVAARPSPLARAWAARWPIGAELVLFLALMVVYEWLRDLVAVSDPVTPLGHALDVIDVEKALGLFVEPDIQDWAHSVPGGELVTTWLYTLSHTTGFVVMFLWMWFRRRRFYAAFRNWFWVANGLAVVGYWLYPLAPPRLTDLGLEDPTKASLELGGALSWFQPFRNEFAAMPSMHFGYTFLFALTLVWMHRGSPWRWLAFLWPAAMLFVIMATANHWWLDAVGGGACVLLALAMVDPLTRSLPQPWRAARA